MTAIRKRKACCHLSENALEMLPSQGWVFPVPLEKNRPKQYRPHPVAMRKAPWLRLGMLS